ncbi:hypothetical protein AB4P17_09965 [Escherichia coli]|uniref:hypothetical protein n=1 Tax=Escherichia coli TaxID=562 RepID=UPI0034C66FC9
MAIETFQGFNIDTGALEGLRAAAGATQDQMLMAYNRALKRTTAYLYKQSLALVMARCAVKKRSQLKKRVQKFTKERDSRAEKVGDLSEAKLWYGLDPFRVHEIKGSFKSLKLKKQGRDSKGRFVKSINSADDLTATFKPDGSGMSEKTFYNAFVSKRYGFKSIWEVTADKRVVEATIPVSDAVQDEIDDQIADQIGIIFMGYFRQDLYGRVRGNVHVDRATRKRI